MVDEVATIVKEVRCICSTIIMYIILQAVENVLGTASYTHNKVNQWTSNVVEQCLNQLTKLGKPFKYIGIVMPVIT